MGFSMIRHFPILELIWSNAHLAFIITRQKQLRICKVKPLADKLFLSKWGWFWLKSDRTIGFFKQRITMYVSWNAKPIDPVALKMIELKLIASDEWQLQKWIDEENAKTTQDILKDDDFANIVWKQKIGEDGKPELNQDGTPVLIQLETPKMNKILRAMREPINPEVETFLAQYQEVDPQSMITGTEVILKAKKIQHLMSNPQTAKMPIILIAVGCICFVALLSQGGHLISSMGDAIHCIQTGIGCGSH